MRIYYKSNFVMIFDGNKEANLLDYNVSDISFDEQLSLLLELSKSWDIYDKEKSYLFYGGSFNPLHDGHRECIRQGLKVDSLDLVIIPDCNPQKESANIQPLKLFQELVNEFGGERVYPGFLALNSSNPTFNWISRVQGSRNLLLGDDSFLNILFWIKSHDLISLLNGLYIVPRKGRKAELEARSKEIQKINPLIKIHFLNHHDYENLSSTDLRNTKT